ncbi:MAG: electron transfer flavoprotein subunit alpha/FixB family protein [Candidatus Kapabacteria bacterium]|nr:electron transfer flavoprotein subunit alpha/FixB family protein [Candidatus Kapabacteria bacterium]
MNSILIVLEPQGNSLKRTSFEAITAARGIAGGASLTGVIINGTAEQINAAGAYGLSSVVNVTMPAFANGTAAAAIATVATQVNAGVVLFGANATGKDVAPRVAVRLQAGLLADCTALHVEGSTLTATRPVYAGKATVVVSATTPVTVVTLRPNVFTAKQEQVDSVSTQQLSDVSNAPARSSVVHDVVKNEGVLDVAEADMIVSGGRGIKGPEHFNLIEDLAKSLGAAVGASRAVVDAGWRPHREQVGQTGKTVSPNLYVACGISGAVQHLAGMSSSKYILAINKDKDAPIFKVADYGIVGDVFDVLPRLTTLISGVTGK